MASPALILALLAAGGGAAYFLSTSSSSNSESAPGSPPPVTSLPPGAKWPPPGFGAEFSCPPPSPGTNPATVDLNELPETPALPLRSTVQAALATSKDPVALRALAAQVEKCGYKRVAATIRARADVLSAPASGGGGGGASSIPWPAAPPEGWPAYLGWPPSMGGNPIAMPKGKPSFWPDEVAWPPTPASSVGTGYYRQLHEEFGEEGLMDGTGAILVGACCAECEEYEDAQTGACGCRKVLSRDGVGGVGSDSSILIDGGRRTRRAFNEQARDFSPRVSGSWSRPRPGLPAPHSWYR